MKQYKLIDNYKGYTNKKDQTNTGSTFMVDGSKNVIINDGEKIESRQGFTLDGASSTDLYPIQSSNEWDTSTGTQWAWRSYDDELEVRLNGVWTRLKDGWSAVDFSSTTFWSSTEGIDLMLLVNGDSNIYEWSGGYTTFSSATTNTITKEGSTSWAEERFLTAGTRKVVIDGTEYTYTGGEDTTTLTGVTPDPTSAGYSAGTTIFQAIRTNSNQPASGTKNDVIEMHDNHIWIGSNTSRDVYVSKNTSFTDYTFSANRAPGEGALLTLDGPTISFVPQEDSMYIASGKDSWFKSELTLSSDNTAEYLTIRKLKTAPRQSAQSESAVGKIKNEVVFISNEPTLDELGRVENISTPSSKPLSDPIKLLFNSYDFTNAHVKYWKNKLYVTVPAESIWLIYDLEKGFWNPPQTGSFRRWAVIDGDLYAHSSVVPETYKMFSGYSDNGNPIESTAKLAYRNYGSRANLKVLDEWYSEGYIGSDTKLTLQLNYDYKGSTSIKEFTIDGSDTTILFNDSTDTSFGKESLGKEPLGSTTSDIDDLPKFRVINTTTATDFYELQSVYSSNAVDARWQILAQGGNIRFATAQNMAISK